MKTMMENSETKYGTYVLIIARANNFTNVINVTNINNISGDN